MAKHIFAENKKPIAYATGNPQIGRSRLLTSLYRYLAELLESLFKLQRSLAGTCASGFVSGCVLFSVFSEHCPCCIDLFN